MEVHSASPPTSSLSIPIPFPASLALRVRSALCCCLPYRTVRLGFASPGGLHCGGVVVELVVSCSLYLTQEKQGGKYSTTPGTHAHSLGNQMQHNSVHQKQHANDTNTAWKVYMYTSPLWPFAILLVSSLHLTCTDN